MRHLCLLLTAALLGGCGDEAATTTPLRSPEGLHAHSELFEREVIEVTEGVHVAVGFGLANSIMIEGDDGLIIIDTLESVEGAGKVLRAFRAISDKPVAAIIYTHNHTDHVFGAAAFAEGRDIPVYAHDSTAYYINRVINVVQPIITTRSMRMFGNHLEEDGLVNAGIGKALLLTPDHTLNALPPTHTFADRMHVSIAGVELELVHAPGETNDQIMVWYPAKRVLFSGDNIYETFPNLYTIRGTPHRDVLQWANSLDQMRALHAEHLVPSHTRPVSGADTITALLTDYRDAIRFVHDQTVRYMNHGLTPDDIIQRVTLPPHLAGHPWLQEYYGTVAWSVRSIFDGYLGWFDGNPAHLQPLPLAQKAAAMADLAGGAQALLERAVAAQENGEAQWALELTDYLLVVLPDDQRVTDLRAAALRTLGEAESNPNARHYYLTMAEELRDGLVPGFRMKTPPAFLASLPIENYMHTMPILLKAEETLEVDAHIGFRFTDTGKAFTLAIRRGVASVSEGETEGATATLVAPEQVWKEVAAGERNFLVTVAGSDMGVEGSRTGLLRFLSYFERR
ncbi:beta-lactamase domain-containing protein [Isoalcanivorax pacificus W11-5]|uniref:Beta-lactamase domain-containing protein n=1 Tax=Isoalcanivorax pacificus W11-5 TaxID=391936 RepID=A0A0B4XID8_9GAMM|nr:alkyl sulfatase dimerization domain-containing protein [Isoalcanivorax pacificus]AJD46465.1 beta-lactamase domain-containing protein [Isoalcanivorax pacificus W11-5]